MISHKNKCIFIHIPKCAGSSVEKAFGLYNPQNTPNYESLTGWCPKNKFLLQHATPRELLDFGLISKEEWDSYYKFVIYRNSWDRAYSDYSYFFNTSNILGKFESYLNGEKEYFEKLNPINCNNSSYEGSHQINQIDYFFLNNERINYNTIIDFKNINEGFKKVIFDLNLDYNFFDIHINKSKNKIKHYSYFYNDKRKKLILQKYKRDIEFFNFKFEDKRTLRGKLISKLSSRFILKNMSKLKLT